MQKPPRFTEIRAGILVFVTKAGQVIGYDKQAKRFDQVISSVQSGHRFTMAMSTCAGILVRSVDADAEIPIAMAHVPSSELGKNMFPGLTQAHVRAALNAPGARERVKSMVSAIAEGLPEEVAAETMAALYSPIFGPDLLAQHVIEMLGKNIEVRIFGGMFYSQQRVPDIVNAIEAEFEKAGAASVVIEHSVLGLSRRNMIAMISPFAEDARDLVRPWAKFQSDEYAVIKLDTSFDG